MVGTIFISSMTFSIVVMKFEQWSVSCRMKSGCISLHYLDLEQKNSFQKPRFKSRFRLLNVLNMKVFKCTLIKTKAVLFLWLHGESPVHLFNILVFSRRENVSQSTRILLTESAKLPLFQRPLEECLVKVSEPSI